MLANVIQEVVFVYIPIYFEEGTASQFIEFFVYFVCIHFGIHPTVITSCLLFPQVTTKAI